jgi:hypothetical protein
MLNGRRTCHRVHAPRGDARIGRALRDKLAAIDEKLILEKLRQLQEYWDKRRSPIVAARQRGIISEAQDDCARAVRAWGYVGPMMQLLCRQVCHSLDEASLRLAQEIWTPDTGKPKEVWIKEFTGQQLSDAELGWRLKYYIKCCRESLGDLGKATDSDSHVFHNLAEHLLSLVLGELQRLGIIGVCQLCQAPFFPSTPRKKFCSLDYEGTDCSSKARSRRSYQKRRRETREKSRPVVPFSH